MNLKTELRDRWAEAIAEALAKRAGGLALVEKEADPSGAIWISMVPRNERAARVEVRLDWPSVYLVIGESGSFEFPYWSGKNVFDDGCLNDIADLVGAVMRGEVVEWGDSEDFGNADVSGMSIGSGQEKVVTGRRSIWKFPRRRGEVYKREYEPYN